MARKLQEVIFLDQLQNAFAEQTTIDCGGDKAVAEEFCLGERHYRANTEALWHQWELVQEYLEERPIYPTCTQPPAEFYQFYDPAPSQHPQGTFTAGSGPEDEKMTTGHLGPRDDPDDPDDRDAAELQLVYRAMTGLEDWQVRVMAGPGDYVPRGCPPERGYRLMQEWWCRAQTPPLTAEVETDGLPYWAPPLRWVDAQLGLERHYAAVGVPLQPQDTPFFRNIRGWRAVHGVAKTPSARGPLSLLTASADVAVDGQLGFQPMVPEEMYSIAQLHNSIGGWLLVVVVGVSGLLLQVTRDFWWHRLVFSLRDFRDRMAFTEDSRLEFGWTLLPMILLLFIGVPSISLIYALEEVTREAELVVDTTTATLRKSMDGSWMGPLRVAAEDPPAAGRLTRELYRWDIIRDCLRGCHRDSRTLPEAELREWARLSGWLVNWDTIPVGWLRDFYREACGVPCHQRGLVGRTVTEWPADASTGDVRALFCAHRCAHTLQTFPEEGLRGLAEAQGFHSFARTASVEELRQFHQNNCVRRCSHDDF
jgi:hypothetical protein